MSIYDTLNKEQKKAVMTTDGPLLILAGAGSGKTRVLTHRIAYLIDELNVNAWNILAITFTNKAAGEMKERVENTVGEIGDSVWVSTFHSLCVRILRRHIDRLSYDTNFTIYDSDDQKALIRNICKRLDIDTRQYKERSIMNAFSAAKDNLVSVDEYVRSAYGDYTRQVYAKVYREYQDNLKRNNALDFDDLIMKTVELFKTCPEILNSYQDRFRYIMVDEYQDTNTAQFELIRILAEKYRNLCVVGDDDQSIYKFRGANIRNILDFEKYFPECVTIKLELNYRSTSNILDAANGVIRHNVGRKDKTLWTNKKSEEKVHFKSFDSAYEEAEYVACDIADKVRKNGAKYSDFAILYRTNAQSRLLEEKLVIEGIPYNVVGSINFYARAEIKDILAYLKTIDNAKDDLAVRRIINIPKRGIGATSVEKVADFADERGIGLFDAMMRANEISSLGKATVKFEAFVNMIRVLRSSVPLFTIAELIKKIVDECEYYDYLENTDEETYEEKIENVEELITKAVIFEEDNPGATLSQFLEEIALVSDIDSYEDKENRITLMTIHAAKGLEFDTVYMTGMEDGIFPSYMSIATDSDEEIEEERRLAYVGITRAKNSLTLTHAKTRMLRGETQYNPISRFVREIPGEVMDEKVPVHKSRFTEDYGCFRNDGMYAKTPVYDVRPKAVLRKKTTRDEDKPFISKGIDSLNKLAGLSKGLSDAPLDKPDFGVGDRVKHIKYGEGTVLDISKEPRDYKVTVMFDEAGQKIMYASFAKLTRV